MHPAKILAHGPWPVSQVQTSWRSDTFQPTVELEHAADRAIEVLRRRGSPTHDGLAARLSSFSSSDEQLELVLQPTRWSLRLVQGAADALTALCIVRSADGLWLAGKRAEWVATWPGRWALGAGGSVEHNEDPVETMTRELEEEWSVTPERLLIEALVSLPRGVVMLVGQAWLPPSSKVTPDSEHDEFSWWPANIDHWPSEADISLRQIARLVHR